MSEEASSLDRTFVSAMLTLAARTVALGWKSLSTNLAITHCSVLLGNLHNLVLET